MLSEENYFSKDNNFKYCGSSQIKSFLQCESKALAELKGEWIEEPSKALLEGSYLDAALSGTLNEFKENHSELFKKDGTLKAEFLQAEVALERIKKDEMFMKYVNGDNQKIMTGQIAGVPIKIKIDSYHKDKALVDFKYIADFKYQYNPITNQRENFVTRWGYDFQATIYQKIVEQNTGKRLPFFIAAVTKEKQPDLALLSIPDEVIDIKLSELEQILPHIQQLKEGKVEPTRCEHCDYCKATKKLTKIIDYRDLDLV